MLAGNPLVERLRSTEHLSVLTDPVMQHTLCGTPFDSLVQHAQSSAREQLATRSQQFKQVEIWGADALYFITLQAVDIAIIKATTAKFSVVPKEKHVRSEPCRPTVYCCACYRGVHQHVPELLSFAR